MTLTIDFTSNQQGLVAGSTETQIRFWDKSITTNGVVISWAWCVNPQTVYTTNGDTKIFIPTLYSSFAVNDTVIFNSGAPANFSANTIYYVVSLVAPYYITLSATLGGGAITAGSNSAVTLGHGSTLQNPIIRFQNFTSGVYDVALNCNDSGGTGATTLTKTGYITAATYTFSKPVNAGLFGRITIFVYDATNATAINRIKSTNNSLFFQGLKCTSSITKAGTATFTVYTTGATATEIGLLVADKNVAIISGKDVIWSGKISRAVQAKMSLYDSGTFMSWNIECESDISKMRYQNVKAANQISYNAPPGYIINKLVEPAVAGDIDWRGVVTPSLISFEGANIQYTITSADMQSQFLTLADLTGYDWRTRNDWMKYAYGVNGYVAAAKTVTVAAIAPYTTNSFAGMWMLFINASNTVGIQAYGNIASNTTTVITLTSITNSAVPPVSSDNVIILGKPVLDFSSDFRQPSYVSTFTMNAARQSTLQNGYEMNDMSDFKQVITKAIAKCKTIYPSYTSIYYGYALANSSTQALILPAKDAWNNTKLFFDNSTFITFKTQGYVHSIDTANKYVNLLGTEYAFVVNDTFTVAWTTYLNNITAGAYTISAVTITTASDGTPITQLTISATPASTIPKYAMAIGTKLYINDNSIDLTGSPGVDVNIGNGSAQLYAGAVDATYGPYLNFFSVGAATLDHPHYPGCIVSNQTYTETSPQTGSPLNLFGLIGKTITSDQQVSLSDLEVYATNYLINYSFYYRKGTFWAFVYDWFKADIRAVNEVSENGWLKAGDEICILQHTGDTATDTEYGQYKNQWQIVAWTLDADQMTVSADLGDHERNTNTLINDKTSGINYTIT